MNKKEYKKLCDDFFTTNYHEQLYHKSLCGLFSHTTLDDKWGGYWFKINTLRRNYIPGYIYHEEVRQADSGEIALLRLVIMYDFLRDIGEWK